jgi:hypothetical protein
MMKCHCERRRSSVTELVERLLKLENWAEGMIGESIDISNPERNDNFYEGYAQGVRDVLKILGHDTTKLELVRRFKRAGWTDERIENTLFKENREK